MVSFVDTDGRIFNVQFDIIRIEKEDGPFLSEGVESEYAGITLIV